VKERAPDGEQARSGEEKAMARTVLVADDEPSILLSLQFLLNKAGYEVRVARDGQEAIDSVRQVTPDLIILDAMMPAVSGYDVCEYLRSVPDFHDIPVIMLTAKGRDIDRQKGMALGATDYITKPFSTRDLVEMVKKQIGSP
jgi:two-component system, OmpR family, alkaline phosphatase synthesis response regulator PhoP